MRSTLVAFGLAITVILGWLLVAPQQLGGPLAAVSTYGHSMHPTYAPHELVLVRRDADYGVGDVVAYPSRELGAVVLHRIVDVEDGRFVTQGDNNEWADPDRPAPDDLIGRAWLSVPAVGWALELPLAARVAVPVAAFAVLGRLGRAGRKVRRMRDRTQGHDMKRWDSRTAQFVGVGAAIALLGGTLAALAWTRPVTGPGPVDLEHQAAFAYTAQVPPGSVAYPDGSIDPGDPIFLRLQDRVDVSLDWTFESAGPADLRATGRLFATVEDGSGWTHTLPLAPETELDGDSGQLSGEVDFAELRALAAEVSRTTGVTGGTQTVTVTGEISADGEVVGVSHASEFAPSFAFRVDELRASLASTAEQTGTEALEVTETGTVTAPDAAPAQLAIADRELSVSAARVLSLGLVALGAVVVVGAAARSRRHSVTDEHQLIRSRYGRGIIDAASLSSAGDRALVSVADFGQLADVAEYRQLPILRVPLRAGGHGYVVDDATARYSYLARPVPVLGG